MCSPFYLFFWSLISSGRLMKVIEKLQSSDDFLRRRWLLHCPGNRVIGSFRFLVFKLSSLLFSSNSLSNSSSSPPSKRESQVLSDWWIHEKIRLVETNYPTGLVFRVERVLYFREFVYSFYRSAVTLLPFANDTLPCKMIRISPDCC